LVFVTIRSVEPAASSLQEGTLEALVEFEQSIAPLSLKADQSLHVFFYQRTSFAGKGGKVLANPAAAEEARPLRKRSDPERSN
jgi:hypothetical protein